MVQPLHSENPRLDAGSHQSPVAHMPHRILGAHLPLLGGYRLRYISHQVTIGPEGINVENMVR